MRTPIGRFGKTEELVGAAGVSSHRMRPSYVSGEILVVDGGFSWRAESINNDGIQEAGPDRS